jgi:intracellular septation protein A
MPRSKIGPLMVVILYVAIGLGALSNPRSSLSEQIWASTIYTVTAFLMTIGTLLAFVRRGHAKMAWIGFAVFGWTYLVLLESSSVGSLRRARIFLVDHAAVRIAAGIP